MITGIRLILATKSGEVVAANIYGKLKTVFQILAIIFLLIELYLINFVSNSFFISVIQVIADAAFYLCVILTVLSGWDYVRKNIKVLKESL
ncbi:CDP-diacylglycerol-glycerol-3-phosphate 3-phosphatidyltransferase [Candidatus Arthromitus sp. SFB-1]|nr:CDP-diacylglycerol-glycerol-3-phosphate 3-phosphatidyltransferase [Candidatus Arthromitus sp. SFB-1]